LEANEPATSTSRQDGEPPRTLKSARSLVLIVEDNPVTRKHLRVVLEDAGFRVEEASDGERALAMVQASLPDLVLQDLRLPGVPGLELLRRLRGLPGGDRLPVVACSGDLSALQAAQDPGSRFDGVVVKPIDGEQLLRTVDAALRAMSAGSRQTPRPPSAPAEES
jgi:CheY-like chemotaxis protein